MNLRKDKGITMIALIVTLIILLILTGISITGAMKGKEETDDSIMFSELNMVQHAILERYTKAQLTKETLPGVETSTEEVQEILDEINTTTNLSIVLKAEDNYVRLYEDDLEKLGITRVKDIYIVNYNTGEVINETKKVTKSNKALYVYSKPKG